MLDILKAIGGSSAQADVGDVPLSLRTSIDDAIRASLLCAFLGLRRERWIFQAGPGQQAATEPSAMRSAARKMVDGLYQSMGGAGYLATLGAAADLDPMDVGPSHTALPATLASCAASTCLDGTGQAPDARIAAGVLAGLSAALKIRRAVSNIRPGLGLHSPGVFGTVAAAAAAARCLGLTPDQVADAIGISLTRSAGLALNSAGTRIGLTHFGWGTAHGLEAALLAADGWTASRDLDKALGALFGRADIEVASIDPAAPLTTADLLFKKYPCNIYLNPVIDVLDRARGKSFDGIDIEMPWIPQLDCPEPADIRQARNSAQAVAAIVLCTGRSYADFSDARGAWQPGEAILRTIGQVRVRMDAVAPTRLSEATLTVRVRSGGSVIDEAEVYTRDLGNWGKPHAATLADDLPALSSLYDGSYQDAYQFIERVSAGE